MPAERPEMAEPMACGGDWCDGPCPADMPCPGREPERDDAAVNAFAHAMADKMARSRAKGRGGWQSCPTPALWQMLREHVEKGDPVDVANLAMMIWHNAQREPANVE